MGLERRQAGAGMAVLGRADHHQDPARLRAGLRPDRAGAAARDHGARRRPTRPTPSASCCAIAARAMGVATEGDLRDYFRMPVAETKARARRAGRGRRAGPGRGPGLATGRPILHPRPRRPRQVAAGALLSPFDNLIWRRERTERLFGDRDPAGDLHPGPQARARLLRPAVPAGRGDHRAGRPEVRPQGRRAARPVRPRPAGP